MSGGVARASGARLFGRAAAGLAVSIALWIGLLLIFLPLALTAYLSFFADRLIVFPPRGYTFAWYRHVLPTFGSSILTSLEVALLGVGLAVLLGLPAGIGLARGSFPGRRFLSVLLLAPLTVPGISLGLAIYLFAILCRTVVKSVLIYSRCKLASTKGNIRARSKSTPARPYIAPLSIFNLLIWPSTCPLLQGSRTALVTAAISCRTVLENRRIP